MEGERSEREVEIRGKKQKKEKQMRRTVYTRSGDGRGERKRQAEIWDEMWRKKTHTKTENIRKRWNKCGHTRKQIFIHERQKTGKILKEHYLSYIINYTMTSQTGRDWGTYGVQGGADPRRRFRRRRRRQRGGYVVRGDFVVWAVGVGVVTGGARERDPHGHPGDEGRQCHAHERDVERSHGGTWRRKAAL